VFLAYVSANGRALIHRELYLPVSSAPIPAPGQRSRSSVQMSSSRPNPSWQHACSPRLLAGSAHGVDVGWFTADAVCRPDQVAKVTACMTGSCWTPGTGEHLLLVRRSISKPIEPAYYSCHTRHPVPLPLPVTVSECDRSIARRMG
jgi:hypothetical protein